MPKNYIKKICNIRNTNIIINKYSEYERKFLKMVYETDPEKCLKPLGQNAEANL